MARKVRVFLNGVSQHILLKSINDTIIFKDKFDFENFLNILNEAAPMYLLEIHAYIIMPNYFEFVATPKAEDTISRFIQSITRRYVVYFNHKYNRTGSLWAGRYKSSLIENEKYLFDVMSYIEKLAPKEHIFCSKYKNLYNKHDSLVSYHTLYKQLGYTDNERIQKYESLFHKEYNSKWIENCLDKQHPTATAEFITKIETQLGMSFVLKRGRPKKENKEKGKKMYKNLVILDKEKHKDLKINPIEDLNFAKNTTFLPVLANEVGIIGATFPVVFTADENTSLVSLLSLGNDCLAINEQGKWITSYLPSFIRKYPFSLANTQENPEQKVILIDEDSKLFSKKMGKELFTKEGEKTETLSQAIKYLTTFENQMVMTKKVASIIAQSGILEDREISVGEGEEKKVLIKGFKVVDKEKLNALSDDVLASWVRNGIINLIDNHLKSLENIQTLFNLAQKRQN